MSKLSSNLALSGGICLEGHVLGNQDIEFEAATDGDRRSNLELTINNLTADLGCLLGGGIAERVGDIIAAVGGKIGTHRNERRQDDCTDQATEMMIDLIGQACIASLVGTDHGLQLDAIAVRHDQAIPNDLGAILAVADVGIVAADDLGPLWDEKVLAASGIEDMLGDLTDDIAGQIAIEAGDESGRDHGSCLDLEIR